MTATEWTNQISDEAMYQVPGSRLRELRQAVADLAACRTLLAALADACERTEKATGFGGSYRAYEAARDWLLAHPDGG